MDSGQLLTARESINNALRIAPTSVAVRELLGESALRVGDGLTAVRAFGDALRLGGRSASIYEGLLLAQLLAGDPDGALRDAPRLPGEAGARIALLMAAAHADRYDLAAAQRELDSAARSGQLSLATLKRRRIQLALRHFDADAAANAQRGGSTGDTQDAVYLQAAVHLIQGQTTDAERLLTRLLADQADHRPALYLQAGLALERGRPGPAMAALEQVAGRASSDVLSRLLGLLSRTQQGRVDTVGRELAQLEPLVLRVPASRVRWRPQVLVAGALVLDALGRREEAVRWWTQAARQPGSPVVKRLARLSLGERAPDAALRWLGAAAGPSAAWLARDPDVLLLRAAALTQQGRSSQALALLFSLPGAEARSLAGKLLLSLNRLDEAETRLQTVAGTTSGALALLHIDLRRRRLEPARRRVDALLRRASANPALLHATALLAWLRGDAQQAQRQLDEALRLNPADSAVARSRARLDAEQGRVGAARARLTAMGQGGPLPVDVLLDLAALSLRDGTAAEVDAWLERAAAAERGDMRAALLLVDRQLRAGDTDAALTTARRLAAAQSQDWLARVVLAQALEAQGQLDDARRELVLAGRQAGYASDDLAVIAAQQLDWGDVEGARYTIDKSLSDAARHAPSLALRPRLLAPPPQPRPSAKGRGLLGSGRSRLFDLAQWSSLASLSSLPTPDPLDELLPPRDPQTRLQQAWRDLALWTPKGSVSSWWLLAAMDRSDDGRPLHPAPTLQAQLEYLSEASADGR